MSTDLEKTKPAADKTPSAKFTDFVLKEYQVSTGENEMSAELRRRVQNYFVKLDMILNEQESKRLSKQEAYRDPLEFAWKNVNVEKLSQEVVVYASMELDPLMSNHINMICYKNDKTKKFDIGFIRGYKGKEIVAKRFGLNPPLNVIVELVFDSDHFEMIKKDAQNPVESYSFRINNPFNRGELVGGFFYLKYEDSTDNKIVAMSRADIEKRKPKYASAEFWGGEKDVWKDKKVVGKETIEGWFNEMCEKTLYNKAYGSITIDGQKVNKLFERMSEHEAEIETTIDISSEVIEETPKMIVSAPGETLTQAAKKASDPIPVNAVSATTSDEMDFPETK